MLTTALKSLIALLDPRKNSQETNSGNNPIPQHARQMACDILLDEKKTNDYTLLQCLLQLSVVVNHEKYEHVEPVSPRESNISVLEMFESKALLLRQRLHTIKSKWPGHVLNKDNVASADDEIGPKVVNLNQPNSALTSQNSNRVREDDGAVVTDLSETQSNNAADIDKDMANELAAIEAAQNDHDDNVLMGSMDIATLQAPPSDMVDELMAMGFPEEWCVTALRENGNDMVSASTWIVDNLDMLSQLRHGECEEEDGVSDDDDDDDDEDDDDEDSDDDEQSQVHQGLVDASQNRNSVDTSNKLKSSQAIADDLSFENYFPNDTSQDNIYNYAQQNDFSPYGGGVRLAKFASVVSSISMCSSIEELEQTLLETEAILASLYAQQVILLVLSIYLQLHKDGAQPTLNGEHVSVVKSIGYKHDLLLNFMKFVVCKNPKVLSSEVVIPLKLSNCICVDTFSQAHTQILIKDVMVKLIMGENNTKEDAKENDSVLLFSNALLIVASTNLTTHFCFSKQMSCRSIVMAWINQVHILAEFYWILYFYKMEKMYLHSIT